MAPKSIATSTAQPTNTSVPATQTTPVDPLASASAPAAPTGLFDLPTYTPTAGQPDPRDATYWQNLAKLKFTDEEAYGKGLREQQLADTNYGDSLQTAIRNRTGQQRGLGEEAMRGNLGASGWLDRTEGEQTTAYTQDRAHAAQLKEQDDQDRAIALKGILQSWGIDASSLLTEAGQRYAEGAGSAAENEAPIVGVGGAAAPATPPAAAKGASKVAIGNAQALPPVKAAIAKRRKAR